MSRLNEINGLAVLSGKSAVFSLVGVKFADSARIGGGGGLTTYEVERDIHAIWMPTDGRQRVIFGHGLSSNVGCAKLAWNAVAG
jgi:hypothetical protein